MNDFVWAAGSNSAIERQIAMTDIAEGTAIGMSGLGLLESEQAIEGVQEESDLFRSRAVRLCKRKCKGWFVRPEDAAQKRTCKIMCRKTRGAEPTSKAAFLSGDEVEEAIVVQEGDGGVDMQRAGMSPKGKGLIWGIVIVVVLIIIVGSILMARKK